MDDELELCEVGPGVFAVLGPGGSANCGFVVGEHAVALVDAQASPRLGVTLRRLVSRVTSVPVRYAIITHHHGDHLFGLQAWPDVLALAHPGCVEQLRGFVAPRTAPGARIAPEPFAPEPSGPRLDPRSILRIFVGSRAAAHLEALRDHPIRKKLASDEYRDVRLTVPRDIALDDVGTTLLDLGNVTLRVSYPGPAHTEGDLLVDVVDRDVMFLGDLGFVHRIPAVTSRHVSEWIALTERLSAGVGSIVPGHGPVAPAEMLSEQRDYLEALSEAVRGEGSGDARFEAFTAVAGFDRWHEINLAVLRESLGVDGA